MRSPEPTPPSPVANIGPPVNDTWESYMVDRVHDCPLEEELPVKREMTAIHGADVPATVSRSGFRWDGLVEDRLVLGALEVECSVQGSVERISHGIQSSVCYNDYLAKVKEMADLTFKYGDLHSFFSTGLNSLLSSAWEKIQMYVRAESVKAIVSTPKGNSPFPSKATPEFVSSNRVLNTKPYVRRHGR
jgi:hypothetical protein